MTTTCDTASRLPYVIESDRIVRGESFQNIYRILDTLEQIQDISPPGITIYLRLQLRDADDDDPPIWNLNGRTTGEGRFPVGETGVEGRIQFLRTSADTDALEPGRYRIEIWYEDTSDASHTVFVRWGVQNIRVDDPETGEIIP